MKRISIVTPCYNEEGNVRLLAERVRQVMSGLPGYDYEHLFADNRSSDDTLEVLRGMAAQDRRIKVIANARNFGQVRSVFNAIKAAEGDAVVLLAADLQDPPEMIRDFVKAWEGGAKVVFGRREKRSESFVYSALRKVYYRLLKRLSDDELMNDVGEFVLFDRKVHEVLKAINEANPYIRGLLTSLGYDIATVPYHMQPRHSGRTTTNFYVIFVYALNGFVRHTRFPLRLASMTGIVMAMACFAIGIVQIILKLLFWETSIPGLSTITVALFLLSGVQLFLIGYLGEIVGSIYENTAQKPLVVERERINFEAPQVNSEGEATATKSGQG